MLVPHCSALASNNMNVSYVEQARRRFRNRAAYVPEGGP